MSGPKPSQIDTISSIMFDSFGSRVLVAPRSFAVLRLSFAGSETIISKAPEILDT